MTTLVKDRFNLWPGIELEYVGDTLEDLDTPCPIIDVDIVEANLKAWQDRCDRLGIANRPHIKTHKSKAIARRQLQLGAVGLNCQKLSEAEVMIEAGATDILITYNIVGKPKIERLARLAQRATMSVTVDSEFTVQNIAQAAEMAGEPIGVLIECDTGAARCGVQSPAAARDLAEIVNATPGLIFKGLMTYPPFGERSKAANFLSKTKALCEQAGLQVETISSGGSVDMWDDEGLEDITEYRIGTYVFFDRSQVDRGSAQVSDCALTVLTTVVSRPTEDRAMIDAGTKGLTSDTLGGKGYGLIPTHPKAEIYALNEEHGYIALSQNEPKPQIGDLLKVIPNHVCVVCNLVDKVILVRGDQVLGAMPVDARGCSV
ncbi:MAG: D-TA family PLP-dependent enzyme [Henriciella sp.]|nr:D-TA family PLP-dependent enzyme [Henriciella sp.]